MQVMFVPGLEYTLAKLDDSSLIGVSQIALPDDMTFIIGLAATLHSWAPQLRERCLGSGL